MQKYAVYSFEIFVGYVKQNKYGLSAIFKIIKQMLQNPNPGSNDIARIFPLEAIR